MRLYERDMPFPFSAELSEAIAKSAPNLRRLTVEIDRCTDVRPLDALLERATALRHFTLRLKGAVKRED